MIQFNRYGPDGHRRPSWTTSGAQAVLSLRAVIANGDFEAYWRYHQQQELRRNHLDHYR